MVRTGEICTFSIDRSLGDEALSGLFEQPNEKSQLSESMDSTVLTGSLSNTENSSEALEDIIPSESRQKRYGKARSIRKAIPGAISYFLHRSRSHKSLDNESLTEAHYESNHPRCVDVEERFHMSLNKCDTVRLPELRRIRADVAPIVCIESDDDGPSLANDLNVTICSGARYAVLPQLKSLSDFQLNKSYTQISSSMPDVKEKRTPLKKADCQHHNVPLKHPICPSSTITVHNALKHCTFEHFRDSSCGY